MTSILIRLIQVIIKPINFNNFDPRIDFYSVQNEISTWQLVSIRNVQTSSSLWRWVELCRVTKSHSCAQLGYPVASTDLIFNTLQKILIFTPQSIIITTNVSLFLPYQLKLFKLVYNICIYIYIIYQMTKTPKHCKCEELRWSSKEAI